MAKLTKSDKAFLIFVVLVIAGAFAWWIWSVVTGDAGEGL